MNKLYIGISGKMGSGKTTLSSGIIDAMSEPVARISMATPIKDLQDTIYKELGMELEGEKDRDLLIALGMWGRGKDADFWLNQAIQRASKLMGTQIIICDDIRFENEAKWFKENGILMRINGEQRGPNVDHNTQNVTETALDNFPFDYYIDNRVPEEDMIMSALYCIAQHLNVSKETIDSIAQELHKEA